MAMRFNSQDSQEASARREEVGDSTSCFDSQAMPSNASSPVGKQRHMCQAITAEWIQSLPLGLQLNTIFSLPKGEGVSQELSADDHLACSPTQSSMEDGDMQNHWSSARCLNVDEEGNNKDQEQQDFLTAQMSPDIKKQKSAGGQSLDKLEIKRQISQSFSLLMPVLQCQPRMDQGMQLV